MIGRTSLLVGLLCAYASVAAAGTTTSTYLGNARRTAYVDAEVPAKPVLQWVYQEKHRSRHAWPEPNREVQYIDFDYATQVAIGQGMVFFGSSADHKVYAVDLATGAETWTFFTEGPVRFAPVVRDGRVYVASDDGHLYCLEASTGQQLWKFRGGPGERKLIGNEQMISHWPARSGVLTDGDRLRHGEGGVVADRQEHRGRTRQEPDPGRAGPGHQGRRRRVDGGLREVLDGRREPGA